MSLFRKSEISRRLNEWLFNGRYNAPRDFKGNEQVEKAEAEALLGVLLKMAPHADYEPFLNRVFDQLEYQLKVRVWPSKGELGAVCANIRKEMPRPAGAIEADGQDRREVAIIARKMQRDEPVGESALWGRLAIELIAEHLVDEATMTRYRSGAFFARKDAYGEEAALQWEAEAKARHDAARHVWRQRNEPAEPRYTRAPNKSVSDELNRAVA